MTDPAATDVDERRPSGRRSLAFDAAVAAAATAVEVLQLFVGSASPSAPGVLLTVIGGAALLWRRAAPLRVLAISLGAAWAIAAVGDPPNGVAALIAFYTVAASCDRRVSLIALVPTAVSAFVLTLAGPSPGSPGVGEAVSNVVLAAGIWGLGAYMQTRRRYLRSLETRAAELEREREQLAHIAVIEERTAIARELHDIVAHSVTVMLVGVRGARDVLRTSPDLAYDTLGRVEATAEQSVAELRRILALLRDVDGAAESRPQPSLGELDALVAEHRASGLPVALEVVGEPRALSGGVELSVYRIVQEALTNVRKHSRPQRVTVTLAFRDTALELEVVDDGVSVATDGSATGHGLIGMRERVALLGGDLEAGVRAGGGFRVAARLPVEEGT